jgi:hypothetical protein
MQQHPGSSLPEKNGSCCGCTKHSTEAASSTEVLLSHYSIERRWGNIGEIFCNQLKGFDFFFQI